VLRQFKAIKAIHPAADKTRVFREYIATPRMNVKSGSGPPNVEHSRMHVFTAWDAATPKLTDLMPPPDDGLNSYNSPQLSVEVGVISIEAFGRGYVAIDPLTFNCW
jgi:hypothetical protein